MADSFWSDEWKSTYDYGSDTAVGVSAEVLEVCGTCVPTVRIEVTVGDLSASAPLTVEDVEALIEFLQRSLPQIRERMTGLDRAF